MPQLDARGRTHVGHVREANEDQFLIARIGGQGLEVLESSLELRGSPEVAGGAPSWLLAVADGMGGHAGGALASGVALRTAAKHAQRSLGGSCGVGRRAAGETDEALAAAAHRAQDRVAGAARRGRGGSHMGTTLTMVYVCWPELHVLHAGDSRCYLLRDGALEQLTHDHTLAQQLVEAGALSADEARGSRQSHVLWNAIGGGRMELQPETAARELAPGDVLLLCSDGLTGHLDDAAIQERLARAPDAGEASRDLVDAALAGGGKDNVTVVVARFV